MPKGYHHITYEERYQIEALLRSKTPVKKIARILSFSVSTIYREISRNRCLKYYIARDAQRKSRKRRFIAQSKPKKMNSEMILLIERKLNLQWSPEQISGWSRLQDKRENTAPISHETIYRYIRRDRRLGGQQYKKLRRKGKRYYKKKNLCGGKGSIPNRIDISYRPEIVDKKKRVGDWELDTIVGSRGKSVLLTMVDRMSKYTMIVLVKNRTSSAIRDAIVKRLMAFRHKAITFTADNGKEFACHEEIKKILKAEFYFARPYHSWERGLNEHTNGLIREYFPKSTCFDNVKEDEVKRVEKLINTRPRKVLKFKTPSEMFWKKNTGKFSHFAV